MPTLDFYDEGEGVTEESLKYFQANRWRLGKVTLVECAEHAAIVRATEDTEGTYNTIVHADGCSGVPTKMYLSGFSCGYGGTGPSGLAKMLKELGKEVSINEIASKSFVSVRF